MSTPYRPAFNSTKAKALNLLPTQRRELAMELIESLMGIDDDAHEVYHPAFEALDTHETINVLQGEFEGRDIDQERADYRSAA